jgi:hypothetical protein
MARRKKPSGRERRSARETIYTRAYWFNRARSLSELHGWQRSEAGDGVGLIGRYTAAVNRPVGQLDARDLVTLLSQGTDPHYLAPVALEVARAGRDPALLRCLLTLRAGFWRTHPYLLDELIELADEARAAGGDELLERELASFVSRWRRVES